MALSGTSLQVENFPIIFLTHVITPATADDTLLPEQPQLNSDSLECSTEEKSQERTKYSKSLHCQISQKILQAQGAQAQHVASPLTCLPHSTVTLLPC